MYTYKVMLCPNNKQATKLRQTMNKCIECQNIIYDILDEHIKNKTPFPSSYDVRKQFTIIKKEKDQEMLDARASMTKKEMREAHLDILFYDVSNDALKQTVKDTYNAFIRFFKKLGKYPNKKQYKDSVKGFYVDPYKIKFTDRKVKLEKICNSMKSNRQVLNYISLAERDRIPTSIPYYNPRIKLEHDRFYICVSVDDEYAPNKKKLKLKDTVIGVDVNLKSIVTSDSSFYKTINTESKIKKYEKKLKREQRAASRKYEKAKLETRKLSTCQNFKKNKKRISKIYKKLSNLRNDHNEKVAENIVKKCPNIIVIEDLDIKSMQSKPISTDNQEKRIKNQIRRSLQKTSFRKFLNILVEKALKYGITIVKADRWYPSSKKCHCCGSIKKDLLISDRVYKCRYCKEEIDRDLNAAINLANYVLV